jgi:hypothetical protein
LPRALCEEVREKNRQELNSARLPAGWGWRCSNALPDWLVEDIQTGDSNFPYEAKSGYKSPPGVPEAKHWAIDSAGASQTGAVYSVQGLKTLHVVVIVGPDLVRDGVLVAEPQKNFSSSLRGKTPQVALPFLKRIYQTLISRAMRSCNDKAVRDYLARSVRTG